MHAPYRWIASVLITILAIVTFCGRQEGNSKLVQPEAWWDVHPRPVYATLEKVGTFQEWFDVYRLTDGTYAIYEPNQFEEAISYLVLGEERGIIIDTGTGIGNIRDVVESLTDLPVSVVLTHEHYDHVAGAYRWDDILMYDNAEALEVLKQGRDNASLQKYVQDDFLWKPLPDAFDPAAWIVPSMSPNELVKDGDRIELGKRTLEVIYTPGHSPGSMCLLDAEQRLLFTGDHFFPGPLYAHAPDVNFPQYIESNRKLVDRIDEFDRLLSGHNDPWVESEVLIRVSDAFTNILQGEGQFDEDGDLRRYYFDGFDVLIRADQI
jgi:glyoxylase-like metal-dependent hydrolase (beta-lactamase superfamily II)